MGLRRTRLKRMWQSLFSDDLTEWRTDWPAYDRWESEGHSGWEVEDSDGITREIDDETRKKWDPDF